MMVEECPPRLQQRDARPRQTFDGGVTSDGGDVPPRVVAHWRRVCLIRGLAQLHAITTGRGRWRRAAAMRSLTARGTLHAALLCWRSQWQRTAFTLQHERTLRQSVLTRAAQRCLSEWKAAARLATLLAHTQPPSPHRIESAKTPPRRCGDDVAHGVQGAMRGAGGVPPAVEGARIELCTVIKPLAWRECCSWLALLVLEVPSSPPALLRTLKEGGVYRNLLQRASPAHDRRTRAGQLRKPAAIFAAVEQFLETAPALASLPKSRRALDLRALGEGKAAEHRDLLAMFKVVLA